MKQISCPFVLNGIHFCHDHVKACSTNVTGPVLFDNYKGQKINWEELIKGRIELKKRLKKGDIPECCHNCFELDNIKNETQLSEHTAIDKVYISHWLHCNCDCIYCVRNEFDNNKFDKNIKKSPYYELLPILKQMVESKILSPHATIFITGGEPTMLEELDGMLELLLPYVIHPITIFTSGIKYNEWIAKGLEQNKIEINTSVDSGTKETYEKIKRVPCFDEFKETIKKYVNISPIAKEKIILKYILIKDINDNVQEIEKWMLLAKELGLKNIRLDIDFRNNTFDNENNIPKHYYEIYNHVKTRIKELDLNIIFSEQINKFLEKGYVF